MIKLIINGNKFTVAFKMKFQPRSNNDINNLYCFKREEKKKIDSKPHMFFPFFPLKSSK